MNFKAILWAKLACEKDGLDSNDGKNIRSKLGTALQHIRFSLMTMDHFADIVGSSVPFCHKIIK